MRAFGIDNDAPRLLLGARKYGKTDYVTVLAWPTPFTSISSKARKQRPPSDTTLIMTKSDERNAAMIEEIRKAAEAMVLPSRKPIPHASE